MVEILEVERQLKSKNYPKYPRPLGSFPYGRTSPLLNRGVQAERQERTGRFFAMIKVLKHKQKRVTKLVTLFFSIFQVSVH